MTTRFWVKSYDRYNRLSERPSIDTRDEAFALFSQKITEVIAEDEGLRYTFVQLGAHTEEGAIVLNEWRAPQESRT